MSNLRAVDPRNISVAIPNWNGEAVLAECLSTVQAALAKAKLNSAVDIVIVDDCSSDSSREIVTTGFPAVRWIDMPTRSGFGKVANRAVKNCSNDYVLLLNNDIHVADDFFLHWRSHFEDPDMFAAATWMLRWDRNTVDSGRRIGVWDRGLIRHWVVEDRGHAAPSLYACGGASIYDKQKFLALGGFDPLYLPMYTEDFDLSYAAWKRGWKVMYEPACMVYHHNSHSSSRTFSMRKRFLYDTKNHFLFVWKNITDPELFGEHLRWLPWWVFAGPFTGRRMLSAAFAVALRQATEARQRRVESLRHEKMSDQDIWGLFSPTEADLQHSPYQGTAGAA